MKKISLIIVGLFLLITSAEAVTIVNHSNKASPGTVLAKSFEQSLNDSSVSFYQASNCEDAEAKFQSTEDAIMIYNVDVAIAAMGKQLNCPLPAKASKTVFIGKSYLDICTNAKNPKTLTEARTMGGASVILSKGLVADINRQSGVKVKGIPYGGSKDVLAAIVAGDIDIGYVGHGVNMPSVKNGDVVCPIQGNPLDKNYIGKRLNMQIPDFPIIKIIYTNSKNPKLIKSMQKAVKTKEFQAYLEKSGYGDVKTNDITQKDIVDSWTHGVKVYELYWK
jgi:hypothetical protein